MVELILFRSDPGFLRGRPFLCSRFFIVRYDDRGKLGLVLPVFVTSSSVPVWAAVTVGVAHGTMTTSRCRTFYPAR